MTKSLLIKYALLLVMLALALMIVSLPATAQEAAPPERPNEILTKAGECNAIFPFSLFEERSDGTNCPPNSAEKATGQILFGVTAFAVGAELISGDVFPLNSGILSGL